MRRKVHTFTGTTSQAVSEREIRNRRLAREAAAEGIVLLKNNGVLPIAAGKAVALFGAGAAHTVKGGTGSGDVNERECVTIKAGLEQAGYTLTSGAWLADYEQEYEAALQDYLSMMKGIMEDKEGRGSLAVVNEILAQVFAYPKGRPIVPADIGDAPVAFYVIARVTGEGSDRYDAPGEYRLSAEEEEHIRILAESECRLVVVINAGSPLDMSFMEKYAVDALIQVSEPGMEGGNAFADIVSGRVNPSGKLTDTWAKCYADYPNARTFSHNNGNVREEVYEEGIYVGYRFFDSFRVKPAYAFGFGLSYTKFEIKTGNVTVLYENPQDVRVHVEVCVTNRGAISGKETAQVYAACPQGSLVKEYKRLCGFAKTGLLAPGASETVTVTFPLVGLTSFDEADSAYVLEAGDYVIAVGSSSDSLCAAAVLTLKERIELVHTEHICPLRGKLREICPADVPEFPAPDTVRRLTLDPGRIAGRRVLYDYTKRRNERKAQACALTEQMSEEQLIAFACGQADSEDGGGAFGAAGHLVPGAAGQTSNQGLGLDIAEMVVADGPAGLRLRQSYQVRDGEIVPVNSLIALNPLLRFLIPQEPADERTTVYYQFCTALPVGTMLAQTFNTELVERLGAAVAEEMNEFGISLWLAPGMNIHRNPLCGRNFEYYSEDPVLSGTMAAAITRGVQSHAGTGTTIKHFACNNQEDNRMCSDSIVSERALREIYLRNFEIAVKESQPMAVMSSYNYINGVHAANNYDTLTRVLRDEWGFEGMVMTDWVTTSTLYEDCSEPAECMRSGNDLIMPGSMEDISRLRKALADGTLNIEDLKRCVTNTVDIILRSNCYEGAKPYGKAEWRK